MTTNEEARNKPRHNGGTLKYVRFSTRLGSSKGGFFLVRMDIPSILPRSIAVGPHRQPVHPTDEGPGRHAAVREAAGGGRGGGLEKAEAAPRERGQEAQDDQPRPQGGVRRPPAAAQGPPDVGVAARAVTIPFDSIQGGGAGRPRRGGRRGAVNRNLPISRQHEALVVENLCRILS